MEFRNSTLSKKLSFIGLGCWRFGDPEDNAETDNPGKAYWGGQERKDSLKTIDAALRGGITHFDTAQSYGMGRSEQITGQRLRKNRENCIIATKIMIEKSSINNLQKRIDLSLKRLNTDYIDIMYIHWPSDSETIKRAVNTLEKSRETGKIRHIGISNFSVSEMKTAVHEGKIDFHQTGYSLLWRESEKKIIPFCLENNISVIAYSFLAQGLLACKKPDNIGRDINDRRKNLIFLNYGNREILMNFLLSIKSLSLETGFSIPELVIAWGKSKKWINSVLIGAKNRKQLDEILAAERSAVSSEIIEKLDKISLSLCFNKTEAGNIFSHKVNYR